MVESSEYLQDQLLTCIGNKRSLLAPIGAAVAQVKQRLGKDRLRVLDAFSGSGVVSRYLKQHSEYLVANDLELYAAVVSRCYLRNRSEVDLAHLQELAQRLNALVDDYSAPTGFFEELYAPEDDAHIQPGERVFYTRSNARRLDNFRRLLGTLSSEDRSMLLGPLLAEASVHVNTSGVFKGFHKDRHTGLGRFGGTFEDALSRIMTKIELQAPVLSNHECEVSVRQEDANSLVHGLSGLDLVYFDPPYNQHPYGSNYFMLNLLVAYGRPERVSRVSGIPVDWQRSGYNVRSKAFSLLSDLVHSVDARFILLSFSSEGFVSPADIRRLLETVGWVESFEVPYNTFRGSRNLGSRNVHVTEHLFLVERTYRLR